MDKISLVYAQNVIARMAGRPTQRLRFVARVANLAHDKLVDVMWAGEDGVWQHLPAQHQAGSGADEELWLAETEFPLLPDCALPGNVEFALRYRVAGEEHWDNNDGRNHTVQADCGVRLAPGVALFDLGAEGRSAGTAALPVAVAVDGRLAPDRVTVHWTTDGWQTSRQAACRMRRDYWDAEWRSNARNPNHYATQIWDTQLDVERGRTASYRIACESAGQALWQEGAGRGRRFRVAPLRVLALNLHCYQESDQDRKFGQIAKAIDELGVDVACFQEVAEHWNDGKGDWASNSARIINARLRTPLHLATDWSHLGFDRYREGVAVLSRYPIVRQEARYVSRSRDPYSIHARKVVLAQLSIPFVGLVNVFSAHLSWWDDGFAEQFGALRQWACEAHSSQVKATLLCGDFNIEAGSRGYELVLESGEYDDGFLAATRPQAFEAIFRKRAGDWREQLRGDGRIDYVFVRRPSALRPVSARELFTERDFGRVSDHTGYLVTLEPN